MGLHYPNSTGRVKNHYSKYLRARNPDPTPNSPQQCTGKLGHHLRTKMSSLLWWEQKRWLWLLWAKTRWKESYRANSAFGICKCPLLADGMSKFLRWMWLLGMWPDWWALTCSDQLGSRSSLHKECSRQVNFLKFYWGYLWVWSVLAKLNLGESP